MKKVLTTIGYILYVAILFAYPVYEMYVGYDGFSINEIIKFMVNLFISFIMVLFASFYVFGLYYAYKGDKDARYGCLYPSIAMFLIIALALVFSYNKQKPKRIDKVAGDPIRKERVVYVCTGPSAKKYHRIRTCRWLDNCSGEIEELTIERAEARGKHPCKGCY